MQLQNIKGNSHILPQYYMTKYIHIRTSECIEN